MNDPNAWEVDDLHELIATPAEESSTLEFKRGQILQDLINLGRRTRLSSEYRFGRDLKDKS